MATITGIGMGACAPEYMGESPVPAVHSLLARTGHTIDDYERIEVNEAFASQYLACEKLIGINREITNVNGSGIGLGHPVGCTGVRILVTLLHRADSLGQKTRSSRRYVGAVGFRSPRKLSANKISFIPSLLFYFFRLDCPQIRVIIT